MNEPTISEDHIVIRVLRYDQHYCLFLEDSSILPVPYKFDREPCLGEHLSITRNQEYGYVMNIRFANREISLC
jgi:hypothetical protein